MAAGTGEAIPLARHRRAGLRDERAPSPAESPNLLARFQGISLRSDTVPSTLRYPSLLSGEDSPAAPGSSLASTSCPSSAALGQAAFVAAEASRAARLEAECTQLARELSEVNAELQAAEEEPADPRLHPHREADGQAPAPPASHTTQQHSKRQFELHARLHRRLERQLQEVEEQQAWEFHQARLLSCDAARRTEQAKARLQRDLAMGEQQAAECATALQDFNEMDLRLHQAYRQNLDHLRRTLWDLEQARQRRAGDARRYHEEAVEVRSRWRAERSTLVRDLAHMESRLSQTAPLSMSMHQPAEVKTQHRQTEAQSISQYEADEEGAERVYTRNELLAAELWERVQVLRPVVAGEVQRAEEAEWRLAQLRAHLRCMAATPKTVQEDPETTMGSGSCESQPSRSAGSASGSGNRESTPHRGWPREAHTLSTLHSPSPELAELHAQALVAEDRVGSAMWELQLQQAALERQLQASLAEEMKQREAERRGR